MDELLEDSIEEIRDNNLDGENSSIKDNICGVVALEPQNSCWKWGDVPTLGMGFDTEEEALNFYNAHARSKGFSVRINRRRYSKSCGLWRSELCCSKEGIKRKHSKKPSPVKPRPSTRTNCKACFIIQKRKNGVYELVTFVEEHNHPMANQSEVHKLRSQRMIQMSQGGVIESLSSAGIGPSKIYSALKEETGSIQNLNFTKTDCSNFVGRKRRAIFQNGDAQFLLSYFNDVQTKNPSFFYSIQVDEENKLSSCFWCDAKSRIDYTFFSDVLCFDTTYKMHGYGMSYAPFVGVNQHGQPVLFGCALLLDETTEAFIWLFQTFLKAMNGKAPKTIFTDQAQAMANAIEQVFPYTHHRLCLWHIYQNAAKRLSAVFDKFSSFALDFCNCIYNNETEDEFLDGWEKLLQDYNLAGNEWLQNLFVLREKWALVYGRQYFCAGITTTQRSESMNSYFKKYFQKTMLIHDLVKRYEEAVLDRREKELSEDYDSRLTTPILKSSWPVEKQAAEFYTRKIFKRFQEQFQICVNDLFQKLDHEYETISTYKVSSYGNVGARAVTFDSLENKVWCSCRQFEFSGILCAHALKVLHTRQLLEIRSEYFLHRWSKDATTGVVIDECGGLLQVDYQPSLTSRYSELAHIALALAVKGSTSEKCSSLVKEGLMHLLTRADACLQSDNGIDAHVEKNTSARD